jgi:hypothetical protein
MTQEAGPTEDQSLPLGWALFFLLSPVWFLGFVSLVSYVFVR